jgi:hypothetical protein
VTIDRLEQMPTLLTYNDVMTECGSSTRHILLGNGFSIGCDEVFRYPKLYDYAVKKGLSEKAQKLFAYLGTSNFEGVLRLLDDTKFVSEVYELVGCNSGKDIDADLALIKNILVEVIAENHLDFPSMVSDEKKNCCAGFLRDYKHIFTTNYDLLLYWMLMHDLNNVAFSDGFRDAEDDHDILIFAAKLADDRGVLFLHGALHLFVAGGEVRKHSWNKSGVPILDLVRNGVRNKQYPLFIAEGDGEKKKDQIVRNGYLSYAWSKLKKIEAPLIVYGHSLSSSDSHVTDAIAENTALPVV